MERYRGISEASSSRDAPAYNYGLSSGYLQSVSHYDQQSSFDSQPFVRDDRLGYYADHLSRELYKAPEPAIDGVSGGYPYSSSYDDLTRRYGYGPDRRSQLSEAYQGGIFDGPSEKHHEPWRMSSPHTSAFLKDVGSSFGSRSHAYGNEEWTSGRYEDILGSRNKILDERSITHGMPPDLAVDGLRNPDDELSYTLKDYAMQNEQPVNMDYVRGGLTGMLRNDNSGYLGASRYESPSAGFLSSYSGAPYDWESARGVYRGPGELVGSSLTSFGREHDNTGNTSRLMDSRAYSQFSTHGKSSAWTMEAAKQAKLDVGSKEIETPSFLSVDLVANGSKLVDTIEASGTKTQDVGFPPDVGKKRRTRWEPVEDSEKNGEDGNRKLKKKTRWSAEKSPTKEASLPDIMKEISIENADIIALRARLIVIGKMLQSGQVLHDQNAEKSPSPEPVFDNSGSRINSRENRAREKLNNERQKIMARLSEMLTESKIPKEKTPKLTKKIYIPVDKHPDYNFVGLIIGPRGNTQKQLQKESGAKIFIRGKGSVREETGAANSAWSDSEDLHVLIEADTEDALNKASEMVEKLLVPIKDGQNELKRAQLRELAFINGALRTNAICFECKQSGHVAKDCPLLGGLILGGYLSKGSPKAGDDRSAAAAAAAVGGFLVADDNNNSLLDVAQLPLHADDAQLLNLFSPFGKLVFAKVTSHPVTGMSLGNGVVKFVNAADARQAAALMNGYQVDGKLLAVKLKTNSEPAI